MTKTLTPKQATFVREYLVDLNATQAATRAGYSARTANEQGARLLANASVAAAVRAGQEKRAAKTEITAERVLEEFWAIAMADPNELVQFRRGACRACWDELNDKSEELEPQGHGGALKRNRAAECEVDVSVDPNPDCLECRGAGSGRAWIADTRTLSTEGKRLYAGVKVTKDGIEVKMHDRIAALVNVGRHLGMFNDKLDVRIDVHKLSDEDLEAELIQHGVKP